MSEQQPIGEPFSANELVPAEYKERYRLFGRRVTLISGTREPAYYSKREDLIADPGAWEHSSAAITEGFIWALTAPAFIDNETADDDRAQEIGNMISFALTQGLTEEQVMTCYRVAYRTVSGS